MMGRRKGLDRAAVVALAVELADEHGIEGFTLAQVARRLGVRSPSLYAHCHGLDDLRRAVAIRAAEMVADSLEGAVGELEGLDAIEAICVEYRAFARRHPGLYGAVQAAVGPEEDPERHRAVGRALTPMFRALAEAGQPGEERVHTARALRAALHGFVDLESKGVFGIPRHVDESFRRMVDLFLPLLERHSTVSADGPRSGS